MKKIVLLVTLVMFTLSSMAFAEVKIGVINLQKALDKCDAGNVSIEKIKQKYQAKQLEIDSRTQAMQKMQEELNNQSSLLSQEAKQEKLEKYQKELKELQRFIKDSNEDLKRKEKKAVNQIGKDLAIVVKKLGKELKFTMIVEEREVGAIYLSEKVDVTDIVVERYNKEWNAKK